MSGAEARGPGPAVSIAGAETWLRPSSYWRPDHLPTSAWVEHAPFAFWTIDALRPRSVVELGTHLGFSYFVFCQAIVQLGLDTIARALDSWEGDEHAGFYDEEVFASVDRVNESEYSSLSQLIRGYFDDSVDQIPDGSVDLLHFDGRHGYEDIAHDFETWLPKLSPRGVALFHDIAEHKDDFGVWRFWGEIETRYPSFAFHHEHGLGILGVGNELPEPARDFFAAAETRADDIRADYEVLGAAVSEQVDNANLAADAELLRNEVARLTGKVEAKDAQISSLEAVIEDYSTSTSWKLTRPIRALGSIGRGR